jgi:hypothetical protein
VIAGVGGATSVGGPIGGAAFAVTTGVGFGLQAAMKKNNPTTNRRGVE